MTWMTMRCRQVRNLRRAWSSTLRNLNQNSVILNQSISKVTKCTRGKKNVSEIKKQVRKPRKLNRKPRSCMTWRRWAIRSRGTSTTTSWRPKVSLESVKRKTRTQGSRNDFSSKKWKRDTRLWSKISKKAHRSCTVARLQVSELVSRKEPSFRDAN